MCTGNTPSCSGSGSTYGCVSGCPGADPTLCSGTCVDTTSNANDCSTCGNACSTTMPHAQPTCVASACSFSCNTGYPLCGGACIDPTNDDNNCNGCGNKCTGGTHCVSSSCQCSGGLKDCNGTCTDTSDDAANCGACGHGCLGGVCTAGVCQPWSVVKAPTSQSVEALAADSQYLVWSDSSLQAVDDVPLAEGPAVAVFSDRAAVSVAVTGGKIELMAGDSSTASLAVWTATAGQADSATVLFEEVASAIGAYSGPVFDPAGANAYFVWVDSGYDDVYQCPVAGTCTRLQSPPQNIGGRILVRASNSAVFFLDEGSGSTPGSLYMQVPGHAPTVVSVPLGGTTLAADTANVYWATTTDTANVYTTSIYAQSVASGGTTKTVTTVKGYVGYLAADGANVYFTVASTASAQPGSIQYAPVGGAAMPKTLWTGTVANVDLVAAAGAIYWVEGDGSTIEGVRFP
jgi:hypothetical protein